MPVSVAYFAFLFIVHAPATTEIYTLSLHDALPISAVETLAPGGSSMNGMNLSGKPGMVQPMQMPPTFGHPPRSEEHTSELQSQSNLVCRLLLEKKKLKSARQR